MQKIKYSISNQNDIAPINPNLTYGKDIKLQVEEAIAPIKETSKYDSWEYYKFDFKLDNQSFEGIVNIGIDRNGNKHLYEVNNIKKTSGISETSPNSPTGFREDNIPQNNKNVKDTSSKK